MLALRERARGAIGIARILITRTCRSLTNVKTCPGRTVAWALATGVPSMRTRPNAAQGCRLASRFEEPGAPQPFVDPDLVLFGQACHAKFASSAKGEWLFAAFLDLPGRRPSTDGQQAWPFLAFDQAEPCCCQYLRAGRQTNRRSSSLGRPCSGFLAGSPHGRACSMVSRRSTRTASGPARGKPKSDSRPFSRCAAGFQDTGKDFGTSRGNVFL